MKLEQITVKLEDGDRMITNSIGILIERDGRVYAADVSPGNIPLDGRVTFWDYCSPEDSPAGIMFTYKPK